MKPQGMVVVSRKEFILPQLSLGINCSWIWYTSSWFVKDTASFIYIILCY